MNYHCNCAMCRIKRAEFWGDVVTSVGILIVVILALLTWGCANYAQTDDTGAGTVVVGEDATGFYFNKDGYTIWTDETVPASYFTPVVPPRVFPAGIGAWHITDALWLQGKKIKLERHNHLRALFPPTNHAVPVSSKGRK